MHALQLSARVRLPVECTQGAGRGEGTCVGEVERVWAVPTGTTDEVSRRFAGGPPDENRTWLVGSAVFDPILAPAVVFSTIPRPSHAAHDQHPGWSKTEMGLAGSVYTAGGAMCSLTHSPTPTGETVAEEGCLGLSCAAGQWCCC